MLALCCTAAHGAASAIPASRAALTSELTLEVSGDIKAKLPPIDSNGPSAFDAQGNLWFIEAVGGTIASTPWRIYKGRSLTDLALQHEFVADKAWARPHGDDTWWAEGLWIDLTDGHWYAVLHSEFNYNQYSRKQRTGYSIDRMSTVALATSTDQGRSWTNLGDIITSDHPSDPAYWKDKNYWRQGPGDPSLYVDDKYFYVYYNSRWDSRDDINAIYSGVRVARCPLAAKLKPGCWKKWYLGKWSTAGIGGHDSDVFNNSYSDTATIFWSQSRQRYVAVTLSNWRVDESQKKKEDYDGFIATATDLGKQDWTRSVRALKRIDKGYYSWPVDPATGSRMRLETDELIWCASEYGPAAECRAARLTNAPEKPETIAPRYPPESVDDFSPGWDRANFPGPP